eukprot:CAMPEP_0177786066 /NCGR_PEP_ID=MMETSP0491_2-20121128/20717_1 /TAXON_ID=63592 /ORGANISM="Tetraselmis chuii, Strain PLY429" /LENGTH=152 /DNA_ID=CAMNT_0019307237 /DNA_START=313 /DNA_END=772 /DNA_ORIENTATION=-
MKSVTLRVWAVVLCMTGVAMIARVEAEQGDAAEGCNVKCKPAYIGDKNCDTECYNPACDWDGGDCDDQWELRRMIVMGEHYKAVDHVEYTAVGPGGQKREVSYEEGKDAKSRERENDWMSLLDGDDEADLPEPSKRKFEHAPWRKQGVEVTL